MFAFRGPRRQAAGVARIVEQEIEQGTDPAEIFVLLPRKKFADVYLEELGKLGIAGIDLANASKLLDDPDIRRLTYLLRFAADREDARAVRGWLATSPSVGVESVGKVLDLAVEEHLSFADAIHRGDVRRVQEAFDLLVRFAEDIEPEGNAFEALEMAGQMLELEPERRDGFRQVIETVMGEEPSLPKVLAVLHEYREQPQVGTTEDSPVRILTLHGSKGLSADVVVIPDLDDVIIPGDGDVVEQRRLMYVSMTRARHRLYLCHALFRSGASSYAGSGARAPGPQRRRSRFLDEAGLESEGFE